MPPKLCLKHLNDVSLSIAILRCAKDPSSSSVISKDGSYAMESKVSKFIREEILGDDVDDVDSLGKMANRERIISFWRL